MRELAALLADREVRAFVCRTGSVCIWHLHLAKALRQQTSYVLSIPAQAQAKVDEKEKTEQRAELIKVALWRRCPFSELHLT